MSFNEFSRKVGVGSGLLTYHLEVLKAALTTGEGDIEADSEGRGTFTSVH